jgi:hypothetical protein
VSGERQTVTLRSGWEGSVRLRGHVFQDEDSAPSGREFDALRPTASGCAGHTLRRGRFDYQRCRWLQSDKLRMANHAKRSKIWGNWGIWAKAAAV